MSDSDDRISQIDPIILQLPETDSSEWQVSPLPIAKTSPPPSPFEDYTQFPFHWTGESLGDTPASSQPPTTLLSKSALLDQFPMFPTSQLPQQSPPLALSIPPAQPPPDPSKPLPRPPRKRRFKQLRRAMSLTHIRHKPTPPDTAPPTPTVPSQVPSSGIKSLESLAHWQLPDPTAHGPSSFEGERLTWPPNFDDARSSTVSYERPGDQLSPPSSIPSESDILPRGSLIGLGIHRRSSKSLSLSTRSHLSGGSPIQSPRTLYPPTIYDTIKLSDSSVLERNAEGKVVAGSPEGLVAYITSPECLDYEVLSDFFLMYRRFMEPSRLLGLLCARFEWGLIRGAVVKPPDNEGMVRVRTFAAIRHWLLNYFPDDFAPSKSLRLQFVKQINSFAKDPRIKSSPRDTRIITELKRCWKRVCAVYWDGQGHTQTKGGMEIALGEEEEEPPPQKKEEPIKGVGRVPSLLIRATREREERLLREGGVTASRSSPDLRRRFAGEGTSGLGTVNSTRPVGRGHARVHSASTIHDRQEGNTRGMFGHRRNLSAESSPTKVLYSKNSSPGLYQSFARGDGREEWPPVIVRADLLATSPERNTTTPSLSSRILKRKLFKSKRSKIVGGGSVRSNVPKSPSHLSCYGQLSDDEDTSSRQSKRTARSGDKSRLVNKDRVDFLAAGMWASFISAASSSESQVSLPRAEEVGEALVQGYIQPINADDPRALAIARSLDKGKSIDMSLYPAGVFDMTMESQESQDYQPTISMSEIERRFHTSTRHPSMPSLPSSPDEFRRINTDIRCSDSERQLRVSPPPIPMVGPPRELRRRPGGDLRQVETVDELQARPTTFASHTSSMSDFSFAQLERPSNLGVPSFSSESRSLGSYLNVPPQQRTSQSPTHRMSGLAMDFTAWRLPMDVESSDDENVDPALAVEKTLLKLEGKYVKKKRGLRTSDDSFEDKELYEIALSAEDLAGPSSYPRGSINSGSPAASIMVERQHDPETRWARRHKHVVDGQECDTPTRHGPFTSSSLFEFIDSPLDVESGKIPSPDIRDDSEQLQAEEVSDLYVQGPTVESAIAELERERLEPLVPRLPVGSPPKPPESYHKSLASHLPFILQYDSTLLARQFTLIEKDICAEIDWVELVEPTWLNKSIEMGDIRDWKGFIMREEGDTGLDTVVARFNLMASWTTSEVILTQSLAERIIVVSKFIHLAIACLRLRNYATLTQIVMGLQSQHVANLTKTWDGLSAEDLKRWQELEELVAPRKNWAKMRSAMDHSMLEPRQTGEGCIPLMVIFMSDLIHTTSRSLSPSKIDFEGLRLRASIIKRTLRMIELSEEYDFQPEAGVAERCLWITAFDEGMLRRIAAGLE